MRIFGIDFVGCFNPIFRLNVSIFGWSICVFRSKGSLWLIFRQGLFSLYFIRCLFLLYRYILILVSDFRIVLSLCETAIPCNRRHYKSITKFLHLYLNHCLLYRFLHRFCHWGLFLKYSCAFYWLNLLLLKQTLTLLQKKLIVPIVLWILR